MNDLEIVYLMPEELTPYDGNARIHTDYDIDTIKVSILEFGFDDPIGIWGPNNLIIEGHGRREAVLRINMRVREKRNLVKVPCIRLDHLTDEQRRVYTLSHNKTAEMSCWDFNMLDAELSKIDMEFDMTKFGFEPFNMTVAAAPLCPPSKLDDNHGYDNKKTISVKLTFDDYASYSPHELEINELANRIGARMSLVKT